jgi:hypothetical protein
MAEAIVSAAVSIIQAITLKVKTARENKGDCERLGRQCVVMSGDFQFADPRNLKSEVGDQLLAALKDVLTVVANHSDEGWCKRLKNVAFSSGIKRKLDDVEKRLNDARDAFMFRVAVDSNTTIHGMKEQQDHIHETVKESRQRISSIYERGKTADQRQEKMYQMMKTVGAPVYCGLFLL